MIGTELTGSMAFFAFNEMTAVLTEAGTADILAVAIQRISAAERTDCIY